ncbi:MAG: hypothetical protein M1822_007360 [Bathelium mastoideum]|nr:MAG: hypothetical protein M1822_007360 [Bathelium mastoideum]
MISGQDHHQNLAERLADALPKDVEFDLHHISTPPARCGAIYSPPSGGKPERTYCETHFLAVSVKTKQDLDLTANVLIYAVEVYIYTTEHLTTIFVSKADSTGFASLLNIAKGIPSPLRVISSAFISWLVESRRCPGRKLVVSLFARAQDQYLFPGSIENATKHVLDDRSLIKWWCRVLDPTLSIKPPHNGQATEDSEYMAPRPKPPRGYLIVPGFDKYEIISFLPASYKSQPLESKSWQPGQHPLYSIAPEPAAPPRCLVPHFPDDPKSRFLDDLDEELPELSNSQVEVSPSKKGSGQWRSVKSMDQFWEMMAFRQECSSGRMVGFIWIVFDAFGEEECNGRLQDLVDDDMPLSQSTTKSVPSKRSSAAERRKPQKLSGIIYPRLPHVKSLTSDTKSEKSKYYLWPHESRGEIVLDAKSYERAHDLLLRLDFATIDVAVSSTRKWVEEVGAIAGRPEGWAKPVVGRQLQQKVTENQIPSSTGLGRHAESNGHVKSLDVTTIKKKRKAMDVEITSGDISTKDQASAIPMSSIRKKPKPP